MTVPVEERVDRLEAVFEQFVGQVQTGLLRLERAMAEANARMDRMNAEANARIDRVNAEANARMDRMTAEANTRMDRMNAEANTRMDRMNAETNERMERMNAETNERMEHMNAETNERMEHMNAETNEHVERMNTETNERMEHMNAETNERMERMERMNAEANERAERDREESRRERRELARQLGDISNRMGTIVEDIIAPSLRRMMGAEFDCGELLSFGRQLEKYHPVTRQRREFDVIAVGSKAVLLNETKATPKPEYAKEFVEFLRSDEFFVYFPEYAGKPLIPVFSSLYLPDDLVTYLTRQSVYAVGMGEEAMQVLNLAQVRAQTETRGN